MKRGVIFVILIFGLLALFIIPAVSAAPIFTGMQDIEIYIDRYEAGELNAPQLIVYIEYIKNKMYETLDKEGKKAFTEEEIVSVFDKVDPKEIMNERRFTQYQKIFSTNDFDIVFRADSFYRHDRAYYEEREEDPTNYYTISYELVAKNTAGSDLSSEIKNFISNFESAVESGAGIDESLRKDINQIRQKIGNIRDREDCIELMNSVGMSSSEDIYSEGRNFYYIIKQEEEKRCQATPKCEPVCSDVERCKPSPCYEGCYEEEICEEQCIEQEVCEEAGNETNCTMQLVCEDVCSVEKICPDCENQTMECWTEQECQTECGVFEQCDEHISAEVRLEGNCRGEKGSDIFINAHGPEFEQYQRLNEADWNCKSEMQGLVKLRGVLQKDVNSEFAEWYFEEFLLENYDHMINGIGGFEYVLEVLTRNEEKVAQNLHCSESKVWPDGFEKIDITYRDNNTNVEVWEKNIPVEQDQTRYYTTLYKYSWIPSRELLKELINYKLSETDTFGPSAKDVAKIRSDPGQMEIVNSLSERYGGSFDVKLELIDEDEEVVLKYFQVNPDVIVKIVDSIGEENPDISVEVEYDILYDFINYVSYKGGGDRIYGPYWVRDHGEGGPGKFFGMVGSISKMWREGITIKPRYALLKLLFNSKNLLGLMGGAEVSSGPAMYYEGEMVSVGPER